MALSFLTGATRYIVNSAAPIVSTGYPLTVAMWAYPTTTGATRNTWSLADPAAATDLFQVGQLNTDVWFAGVTEAGSGTNITVGSVTANAWAFLLARFISTTNRYFDVLLPDGSVVSGNSSVSRAPTNLSAMAAGVRIVSPVAGGFLGRIAELWYAATDIGQSGAISPALVRQLAYGGPFSVPALGKDIIEYRSLRKHPLTGDGRDIWFGAGVGLQSWSNVNGVTIGPHPPLPYWYENPRQRRVLLPF